MAKRTRRKQGAKRVFPRSYNADLIHGHRGVDRRFPHGLKVGDQYVIFPHSLGARGIAARNTDPIPDTQTHGKRGMVISRATGPVEVAPHRQTEIGEIVAPHISRPTVIPKMELKAKQNLGEQRKIMKNGHPDAIAVAFWQSTHFQGFTEFLRQVITDRPHARLEYWFSGAAHFYIRIVDDIQWISSVHRTKEILETKKKAGILQWDGPYKAPPKSS